MRFVWKNIVLIELKSYYLIRHRITCLWSLYHDSYKEETCGQLYMIDNELALQSQFEEMLYLNLRSHTLRKIYATVSRTIFKNKICFKSICCRIFVVYYVLSKQFLWFLKNVDSEIFNNSILIIIFTFF